jgi:hypothetical protein
MDGEIVDKLFSRILRELGNRFLEKERRWLGRRYLLATQSGKGLSATKLALERCLTSKVTLCLVSTRS